MGYLGNTDEVKKKKTVSISGDAGKHVKLN